MCVRKAAEGEQKSKIKLFVIKLNGGGAARPVVQHYPKTRKLINIKTINIQRSRRKIVRLHALNQAVCSSHAAGLLELDKPARQVRVQIIYTASQIIRRFPVGEWRKLVLGRAVRNQRLLIDSNFEIMFGDLWTAGGDAIVPHVGDLSGMR